VFYGEVAVDCDVEWKEPLDLKTSEATVLKN
jgi:hypothetical protein